MNILVTGGAGFIGSHTVVSLSNAGFNPVIVDDFSNSQKSVVAGLKTVLQKDVPVYPIDCNNYPALLEIVQKEKIAGVIHFAASKAVGESMQQPLAYYKNNLGGLMTVLDVMLSAGVKNLIFSSSCTVYGDPKDLPVTEESPIMPAASVYGNTKQMGEEIIRDTVTAAALNAVSLRYFNPIGAHPSAAIGELPLGVPSNLVPYVTQTAAGMRESLTVFGDNYPTPDGSCIRDYIHVMDLAAAHVAALNFLIKKEQWHNYDVFNVGTGIGHSVLELIKTFELVSGKPLPYKIGARRDGDIPAVWSDVHKVNTILGWKANLGLKDGLEDAWRWQQALVENSKN